MTSRRFRQGRMRCGARTTGMEPSELELPVPDDRSAEHSHAKCILSERWKWHECRTLNCASGRLTFEGFG